jgi:hypothetical protein
MNLLNPLKPAVSQANSSNAKGGVQNLMLSWDLTPDGVG